jgi:exonuclease III
VAGITTYLSILTLYVNRLNSPIKRHLLANWIKKEDPTVCCLQETHLIDRNKPWLRVKGWKKIYQANGPWKQAGVAILILDKVDFKLTLIRWDKEGHSILIKGEIHQKKITNINLHVPKVSAPNFIKHTLKDLKAYIDYKIVVMGDINTPLSPIDRSSKQNINKRNSITKSHHRSNGSSWCLQNISSNFYTIYTLLSNPWNFLQNWSYIRAQSKPWQI